MGSRPGANKNGHGVDASQSEVRCPTCGSVVGKWNGDMLVVVQSKGTTKPQRLYNCIAIWCCGELVASIRNASASKKTLDKYTGDGVT